ncbi:hypothetical protein CIL06_03320 [Pantoea vagans]|nr:hypothetical protein CIL06_03320 [Pantoea vagans]
MTQTLRKRLRPLSAVSRPAITGWIVSGRADHSAKRDRDLPFLHSFDPFYPQAGDAQRSLRQLREKPAGIWRNALNFRATSHFIPRIRQADRNKIPYDPCALERSPYNPSPDIML